MANNLNIKAAKILYTGIDSPSNFLSIILTVILFSLSAHFSSVYGQESFKDKIQFNGYVSNLGQGKFLKDVNGDSKDYYDYTLHNRLNLTYFPNDSFTFHLQLRNQFVIGQTFDLVPDYTESFTNDPGFMDLRFNWWEAENNLLNTQIDRLYLEFMKGNWELGLGRQRINWGRTLVWNPNDIFNAFSFYDVDYPERPGSDALRVRYYYGIASEAEIIAKLDHDDQLTVAGLTKFNKWSYDFQFMGGFVNGKDFVIGSGWEGSIGNVAFRGEATYYRPRKNFAHASGAFLSAISLDYAINSKLTAQFEFLYNDPGNLIDLSQGTQSIYSAPASSKELSFSEFNFFGSLVYQINPIFKFNLSGMYYTDYRGYFIMPNIDISLTDNINANLTYQGFNFKISGKRQGASICFARLKWNF